MASAFGNRMSMLNPGRSFHYPKTLDAGPTWLGFEEGKLVWTGHVLGGAAHSTNRAAGLNYLPSGTKLHLILQQLDPRTMPSARHQGVFQLQVEGHAEWNGTYEWHPSANGQDALMWLHHLGPYPFRFHLLGYLPGISYAYSSLGKWYLERV